MDRSFETREGESSRLFFLKTGPIPGLDVTGKELASRINALLPRAQRITPSAKQRRRGEGIPYKAGSLLALAAAQRALRDSPVRPASPRELVAYLRATETGGADTSAEQYARLAPWEQGRHDTSNAGGLLLYDTRGANSTYAAQLERALAEDDLLKPYPLLIWGVGLAPDPQLPAGVRFTVTDETETLHAPAFADPGKGSAGFYTLRDVTLDELVTDGRVVSTPTKESPAQLYVNLVPGGLRILRRQRSSLQAIDTSLGFNGYSGRLLMTHR